MVHRLLFIHWIIGWRPNHVSPSRCTRVGFYNWPFFSKEKVPFSRVLFAFWVCWFEASWKLVSEVSRRMWACLTKPMFNGPWRTSSSLVFAVKALQAVHAVHQHYFTYLIFHISRPDCKDLLQAADDSKLTLTVSRRFGFGSFGVWGSNLIDVNELRTRIEHNRTLCLRWVIWTVWSWQIEMLNFWKVKLYVRPSWRV